MKLINKNLGRPFKNGLEFCDKLREKTFRLVFTLKEGKKLFGGFENG